MLDLKGKDAERNVKSLLINSSALSDLQSSRKSSRHPLGQTSRLQMSKSDLEEVAENDSDILRQKINFEPSEKLRHSDTSTVVKMKRASKSKTHVPKYMWRHNNKLRMNWDLFIILLALYNCILIPFNVAFPSAIEQSVGQVLLDRTIDILFGLDLILNFRTTYINPKTNLEVFDQVRIAKNYFYSSRFWVDLLASIPFEVFMSVDEDSSDSE